MPSRSTRLEIVTRALSLAGRDVRLRTEAEQWLNDMLRDWAFEYKYPCLRKIGSASTLASGQSRAALPADFGAGTDNLLFGSEKVPIYERDMDEFVQARGFQGDNPTSGRPTAYAVDHVAQEFVFNATADKDYPFIPIYYRCPDAIAQTSEGDSENVWMPNDALVVQGLIEVIYQYTGDQREQPQYQKVQALKANYRRGVMPMGGGSSRIKLARTRFK